MGYQSIQNLYANNDVLVLFKEVYYLEKIHGTSTHIEYHNGKSALNFYSGGVSLNRFKSLFDHDKLFKLFEALGHQHVVVYGEAYGASVLKQANRYGKELRFVAFEVKIGDSWLAVPNAEDVVKKLGLPFVPYVKGPATLPFANLQRDQPSVQAALNGVAEPQQREGVIIRPLMELTKNNGDRLVAKHKHPKFAETKTPREVDPEQLQILSDAHAVADEWVVPMRLEHVMDKLRAQRGGEELTVKDTGAVVKAMVQDVKKESTKEVVWSPAVSKAIGKVAAELFRKHISKIGV